MPTKTRSVKINFALQRVNARSKMIKTYHSSKIKDVSNRKQSRKLNTSELCSMDLVKFVRTQRRAITFDQSYTTETLVNIFNKAKNGRKKFSSEAISNFDMISTEVNAYDDHIDSIQCEEVRFYQRYILFRYDLDFEIVRKWKKTTRNGKIQFRNPPYPLEVIGAVEGSTWLVVLMYFPLALAMRQGSIVNTAHVATAGLSGLQLGVPYGAVLGSLFGSVGAVVGGLAGGVMGVATAFAGSVLERRLQ